MVSAWPKNIPTYFLGFHKLTFLDISCNEIKEISSQIGLITTLRTLYASNNQLLSIPADICKYVFYLNQLDYRFFNTTFDVFCRCVNLENLILTDNNLITVPFELGKLSKLKKLGLAYNRIVVLPPGRFTSV